MELAGLQVNCPTCGKPFNVPAPSKSALAAQVPFDAVKTPVSAKDRTRHWLVDVRVLLVGVPPIYIELLVEVPNTWTLSADGTLPDAALEAVKKAVSMRYPQSPSTRTKVRVADAGSLQRMPEQADYRNESCQIWFLGKMTSKLQP